MKAKTRINKPANIKGDLPINIKSVFKNSIASIKNNNLIIMLRSLL